MTYAILDFATDGISNFFRSIMWAMIRPLMEILNVLLNALLNGILPISIISNEWVTAGYKACIILMISILPAKIAWEIFYAIMMDADNVDPSKKIFGAIMCFMIAVSMQYVIPMVNNVSVNASNALMTMEYSGSTSGNKKNMSNQQSNLSKNLVVSVLCSFGGMDKNNTTFSYVTNGKGKTMDIGAESFYDNVMNSSKALSGFDAEPSNKSGRSSSSFFSRGKYDRWSFYYRWDTSGSYHFGGTDGSDDFDLLGEWDTDDDFPEAKEQGKSEAYGTNSVPSTKAQAKKAYNYMVAHAGDYIWDFSYIGTLVGLVIFIILLGYVSMEIAMRIMMIGFWYIISPLCCLSLTNPQNPQAFNVWKNAIIGAFLVNFTQLFLLQFFMNISSTILNNKATGVANTITSLILYIASFSCVIAAPSFVQSMIGGYGAGFLESMNQMRGIWNSVGGGAVMSAGKKVFGRHNDMTGHLTGGIRGKLFGNKNMQGKKVGGVARTAKDGVKNTAQSVGDAVLGKKDRNPYTRDKDGNSVANPHFGDRSGGLVGAFMGDKSNANDGRMGRVPVSQRVSKKVDNAVKRGSRNFRYASNATRSKSGSSSNGGSNGNGNASARKNVNTNNVRRNSSSMNTLFSNTYSNKNNGNNGNNGGKGGKHP